MVLVQFLLVLLLVSRFVSFPPLVILANLISCLQFMKTSAYIQIVGFIDNTAIGLSATDSGGELDPHGADLQGNPLGGVVYSNGTTDSTDGSLTQIYNWNLSVLLFSFYLFVSNKPKHDIMRRFVGSGLFCVKLCYNSITNPDYCLNTDDLVGCDYNMPSNVQNGTYTSCEGELQDVVGVYTVNGVGKLLFHSSS